MMTEPTEAATMRNGRWVLTYESQGCYDDGGIGHDDFWVKREHRLEGSFDTDEKAVVAAKRWIRKQSGQFPCRGSFCSNKGRYRLVGVEFVVPEQRRVASATSGSTPREDKD